MLLALNTLLAGVMAVALADRVRASSPSAWLAAVAVFWIALVAVVSEAVGRFVYTAESLTAASVALGAGGAWLLWRGRSRPRFGPPSLARRCRALFALPSTRLMLVFWGLLTAYSAVAVATLLPTIGDVLKYHLPMVVRWAQMGVIQISPELDYRCNHYPHVVELLNGWVFVLTGTDRLICLPQLALAALYWPLVMYLGLRLGGLRRSTAALGAFLASFQAHVVLQMRNEMVDVGFYGSALLAFCLAVGWRRFYGHPWPVFGAALGLALGIKSSGVMVVGVAMLALVLARFRRSGWSPRRALQSRFLFEGGVSLGVAALVGGWVYFANLIKYGNPVAPHPVAIGPFELPVPEIGHMISVVSLYGQASLSSLVDGFARWPKLLFGFPPFDSWTAGQGGFGPLLQVVAVLVVVLVPLRLLLDRSFSSLRRLKAPKTGELLIALFAWGSAVVATIPFSHGKFSPADGRYQMYLPMVLALVLLTVLRRFPRRLRAAVGLVLVAAAAWTSWDFVAHRQQRGLRQLKLVVERERDPTVVWAGRPLWIISQPERLHRAIGDEDLAFLSAESNWIYPLYYPDFSRKVHLVFPRTQMEPKLPELLKETLTHLEAVEDRASENPWTFYIKLAVYTPYIEAVMKEVGLRHLYTTLGPAQMLIDRPGWQLIYETENRRARRLPPGPARRKGIAGAALFRYSPERAARFPSRPLPRLLPGLKTTVGGPSGDRLAYTGFVDATHRRAPFVLRLESDRPDEYGPARVGVYCAGTEVASFELGGDAKVARAVIAPGRWSAERERFGTLLFQIVVHDFYKVRNRAERLDKSVPSQRLRLRVGIEEPLPDERPLRRRAAGRKRARADGETEPSPGENGP